MKTKGKGGGICAGTFLLALTSLVALGETGAGGAREPKAGTGAPALLDKAEYTRENFAFKRVPSRDGWLLTYRFRKQPGDWHEVTCRISGADHQKAEASFGFREVEWRALYPKYLEKTLNEEGASERILDYGRARVSTVVQWIPEHELVHPVELKIAEREREAFFRWYGQSKKALSDKAKERFNKERGFSNPSELGWIPDYSKLIAGSSPVLRDCIDRLNRETGGEPELLMAFFQSMRYMRIKDGGTTKETGDFDLPCTVMIRGEGDCDSKAAAFCAIQRGHRPQHASRPPRLAVLRSLGRTRHALVGVEAWQTEFSPPSKARRNTSGLQRAWLDEIQYKDPVRFGNWYYWPCEVAGSKDDRTPQPLFGQVAPGHGGTYVAIEIQPLGK